MNEQEAKAKLVEGIDLCRSDRWRDGYHVLQELAPIAESKKDALPPIFYSYFGVAMARSAGRKKEGLNMCRYAIKAQPMEPDNHVNLGYLYLMMGNRPRAWRRLEAAKSLEPRHARLQELHEYLGVRREPVFKFLDRTNPLNVTAGRIRSWWEARTDDDLD